MARTEGYLVKIMANRVASIVWRHKDHSPYSPWPGTVAAAEDAKGFEAEFRAARYVFQLAADYGADLSKINTGDMRVGSDNQNVGPYGTGFPALVRAFGVLESAGVLQGLESADLSQHKGEE